MLERILEILYNVRYWETCPEDYKRDIEAFLDICKSNPVFEEVYKDVTKHYCNICNSPILCF